METPSLKLKTARTLKWNTIDRVSSQVIYALVGIVLANILSKEDFGLVGALAIFQAFAILFVDSGFGAALLQKRRPTRADYSTVFWFNLAVSVTLYVALYLCAPLIADIFGGDRRLIPLSKVMFLTFVINGLAIVQTNRLMKRMEVRMIAVSNLIALVVSGVLGIVLAFRGYGAWAMVWQQVSLAAVKTVVLWATGHWWPAMVFSVASLRRIWGVGISVFSSSMLNTICLNIYNFVIGIMYGMVPLGLYTQAEKWSKMGSASISQVLTASFVPLLAKVQDSLPDFRRYMTRIGRFTSLILFPFMIGLTAVGTPLFHAMFGVKWDEAIPLFRILMVRGIFVVLLSLYSNFLLSLGKSRALFICEVIKDSMIAVALLCTVWFADLTLLVWGQLLASVLTWMITLLITSRATGKSVLSMLADMTPFFIMSVVMGGVCMVSGIPFANPFAQLAVEIVAGGLVYMLMLKVCRVPELPEALAYLLGRFRRKG